MPPETATTDRGMLVLEQKLSILKAGPGRTRRNPALDILTGRVPDERLASLQAVLLTSRTSDPQTVASVPEQRTAPQAPTAMVLPVAAIRMAAVARSSRPAPSPWLSARDTTQTRPRLRLVAPPPSRWSRVPWLGPLLVWLRVENRTYRSTERNHPARLAS